MSDDIVQWIDEIKTLRKNLAAACEERDSAYASAQNWQKRYETEAQQRRTEAQLQQQKIQALTAEISTLQASISFSTVSSSVDRSTIETQIQKLDTIDALRQQLIDVTLERDQLRQSLQSEREHHNRTRQHLTAAVGDAVDQLTKERGLKKS